MVVIWHGRGYLVLAAAILPWALFAVTMIMAETYHPDPDLGGGLIPLGLGFLGVGYACWVVGRRANAAANYHTLYFIPVQFWGLLYAIFGGLAAVGGCVSLLRTLARTGLA